MKTFFVTEDNQGSTMKYSDKVWLPKQRLLDHISIAPVIVTTIANGLLYSDVDPHLVAQW